MVSFLMFYCIPLEFSSELYNTLYFPFGMVFIYLNRDLLVIFYVVCFFFNLILQRSDKLFVWREQLFNEVLCFVNFVSSTLVYEPHLQLHILSWITICNNTETE